MSNETDTFDKKEVETEIGKAVTDLREVFKTVSDEHKTLKEKVESLSGVDQEKFQKIETDLAAYDEKHNKLVLAQEKVENEKKELTDRLENMESKLIKGSNGSDEDYKETNEYKALNEWCKAGISMMPIEMKDYLRTDKGPKGGFLVPEILAEDVLRQIEEISNVRSLSRVRPLSGVKTLNIPIRVGIPTASFEGEKEVTPKTESTYNVKQMTAHRQSIVTESTWDILGFAGFDMENELTVDAITGFAVGEGNKFLLGTGVKQPQGILDATAGVQQIPSAATGVVSMIDVIKLSGNVKIGYNLVYFFNRSTLTALRTEVGSNGQFIWRFQGESQPTTINGFNYVILQDMPAIATDSLSVGIGDFFRGYNILDAVDLMMIRDEVTQGDNAAVKFYWHRWLDGMVVLAEAFKLLKTKA